MIADSGGEMMEFSQVRVTENKELVSVSGSGVSFTLECLGCGTYTSCWCGNEKTKKEDWLDFSWEHRNCEL